jgi:hypothetical protein
MTTKPNIARAPLLTICVSALVLLCAAPVMHAQKPTAAPELTDDEIGVYTSLLHDLYQAAKNRPIILSDQTALGVPPGMLTNLPVQGPQTSTFINRISAEARQNWEDLNKSSLHLPSPCKLAPDCTMVDLADVALEVKDPKAWRKFLAKHPNTPGILLVSRIGFNRERDQAVVYSGVSCGQLCGQGEYTWLLKHDGVWAVESSNVVWISTK